MGRFRRRWQWLGIVTLAMWTAASAAAARAQTAPDPLSGVLERAAASVRRLERELSAVVIEEHFTQRTGRRTSVESQRDIRSDLLLVRAPGHDGWLSFRDVFDVNGNAVRDRSERLQKLFLDAPDTALSAAARINAESSRYNLGPVTRTINTPTFGLMLLRPAYTRRLEVKKRGDDVVAGRRVWRVTFVERVRPTIVRSAEHEDVPIEGSWWIEPASGRVVKTLVKTLGTPDPGTLMQVNRALTLVWIEVTFAPSDSLGFWVPASLKEWARNTDGTEISGAATYRNFRRFTVTAAESFQGEAACVALGTPKPAVEYRYRLTDSRGTSSDFTTVWEEVTATSSRSRTARTRPGGTTDSVLRYRVVDDVSVIDETVQSDAGTTTFMPGVVGDPFGRACAGRTWPIASATATNRSARGTFSTKSDAGELKMLGLHESVTVPAGTFDTIHYTRTTTGARGTIVDEYWKSIEHGVIVRHLSAVAGVKLTEELQSIR